MNAHDGDSRASGPRARRAPRSSARALAFAALWLVLLPSVKAGDLAMGLAATAAATWTSLRLLAARGPSRARAGSAGAGAAALARIGRRGLRRGAARLRARAALAHRLRDLSDGLRRGAARNGFATITSLLPGTVPAEDTATALVYHALDTAQPVVASLAAEERRLAGVLQPEPSR